jgi:hypothetical protein
MPSIRPISIDVNPLGIVQEHRRALVRRQRAERPEHVLQLAGIQTRDRIGRRRRQTSLAPQLVARDPERRPVDPGVQSAERAVPFTRISVPTRRLCRRALHVKGGDAAVRARR